MTAIDPAALQHPAAGPCTLFVPSPTNPRTSISEAEIDDLAEKIVAAGGVLQPILARPSSESAPGAAPLEIVYGHSRWRACAKLTQQGRNPHGDGVPYFVRNLADEEVLVIQAVENIGRNDLHPLDEARHYQRMLQATPGSTFDQVARAVKVDPARVRRFLALLQLQPQAVEAFYAGRLTLPLALQVARMPATVQAELVEHLANWGGEPMGPKAAAQFIRDRYMLRLAQAPFDPADPLLLPEAGACGPCPKRTGAHAQLFEDIAEADTCTDTACFARKKAAQRDRMVEGMRTTGYTVLQQEAAREACTADGRHLKPGWYLVTDPVPTALGDGALTVGEVMRRAQAPQQATHAIDHPGGGDVLVAVPQQQLEAALRSIKAHRTQLDKAAARKQATSAPKPAPKTSAAPAPAGQEPQDDDDAPAREAPQRGPNLKPCFDDDFIAELLKFKPVPSSGGKHGLLSHKQYVAEREARARAILTAAAIVRHIETDGDDALPRYGIGGYIAANLLYLEPLLDLEKIAQLVGLQDKPPFNTGQRIQWLLELPDDDANVMALVMLALQDHGSTGEFNACASAVGNAVGADLEGLEAIAKQSVARVLQLNALESGSSTKGKGEAKAKTGKTAKVLPKYRDPTTGDTWSGRGLQPRWLKVKLAAGAKLTEFEV